MAQPTSANITSIEAVSRLKGVLAQFGSEVNDALVALELEVRRPVDWIENDRSRYWPDQVQKASNEVSEARLALQKGELTIDGSDARYCYEERKALEKAKRRLHLAEEKVQAVKRWKMRIRKEVEEFQVQIAKLRGYLDSDLVRAMAALGRMSAALDRYTQQSASAGPPSAAVQQSEGAPP
jgi:chromosome segregation ATPase